MDEFMIERFTVIPHVFQHKAVIKSCSDLDVCQLTGFTMSDPDRNHIFNYSEWYTRAVLLLQDGDFTSDVMWRPKTAPKLCKQTCP